MSSRKAKQERIGNYFIEQIEDIRTELTKRFPKRDRIPIWKITNLIAKHKEGWPKIKEDLKNIKEEEIERLCN